MFTYMFPPTVDTIDYLSLLLNRLLFTLCNITPSLSFSLENYSEYVQEHPDKRSCFVQYHSSETPELHPLEPVTVHHQDCYVIKTGDGSRNMNAADLLQNTGGNGGEVLLFYLFF